MNEHDTYMSSRLTTPRLLLKAWSPEDASQLEEAVESSLEHLREWLPWARREPLSLQERTALLEVFERAFLTRRQFLFGIWSQDGEHLAARNTSIST